MPPNSNPDLFGAPPDPALRHRDMLGALAAAGLPAKVIGALVASLCPDALALDDRRFLEGPIVVHESPWNDTRPDWLGALVGAERAAIVFGTAPAGQVIGPAELACVMYGASLDRPLRRDAADLYVWATMGAVAARDGLDRAAAAAKHGIDDCPADDAVLRPAGRLNRAYLDLARDVRRKVIAAQEQRDRVRNAAARREAAAVKAAAPPEIEPDATAQLGLFT